MSEVPGNMCCAGTRNIYKTPFTYTHLYFLNYSILIFFHLKSNQTVKVQTLSGLVLIWESWCALSVVVSIANLAHISPRYFCVICYFICFSFFPVLTFHVIGTIFKVGFQVLGGSSSCAHVFHRQHSLQCGNIPSFPDISVSPSLILVMSLRYGRPTFLKMFSWFKTTQQTAKFERLIFSLNIR